MFRSVFTKTLYDVRLPLLFWSAGMAALCVWFVSLYPAVGASTDSALLTTLMENLPDSIKLLIGSPEFITSFEGFLATKLMNMMLPLLGIGFGLSFGGGMIGGEEDEHSLDLLLANPVPRWRVIVEKYAVLVLFTAIVYAACYAALVLTAAVIGVETDAGRLLAGTLNLTLLVAFFATLTLCISALRRGRGLATGVSLAYAAVTFLTNNLRAIVEMPDWLTYLSPWYYYDIQQVLFEGINWGHVGVLGGLTLLLAVLGVWGFSQRDVGT